MRLSAEFAIDKREPWVAEHNKEVVEVMDAYRNDRPIRVPLILGEWAGQHGFYMDEFDLDYRDYYNDPDEMLRVQLESAKRKRELPWSDMILGEAPESWPVSVDLWPVVAPGAFGCELAYRPGAVIAHRAMALGIDECKSLSMPDVFSGGILAKVYEFYHYLKDAYENKLFFLGAPVKRIAGGAGTNGVFSLSLDLRGPDIMADMYEDPEFAAGFLERLANWIDELETKWDEMCGVPVRPFSTSDHGIDMLSAELYEKFLVPIVIRHNRLRGTEASTHFHHCGRGVHLFDTVRRRFGIDSMNALTYPTLDIERVRSIAGEEAWLTCLIEGAVLQYGTEQQIADAVRGVMKAKGKGRFAIMAGDMLRGVPAKNMEVLYEAVRAYGKYD